MATSVHIENAGEEVAELMLERGLTVGIGESPAIGTCTQGLRAHGVLEECRGIFAAPFRVAQPARAEACEPWNTSHRGERSNHITRVSAKPNHGATSGTEQANQAACIDLAEDV